MYVTFASRCRSLRQSICARARAHTHTPLVTMKTQKINCKKCCGEYVKDGRESVGSSQVQVLVVVRVVIVLLLLCNEVVSSLEYPYGVE